MRSAFLTRSRMVTSPSPSRLGGRVSRRTTWGCWSWSSAASSQVMMRSSPSMKRVRQLSSVVLPLPVPPEMSTLQRLPATTRSSLAHAGLIAPSSTSFSRVSLSFLNLRMVIAGPSRASGGTITLTRLPSCRRASHTGLASSTRRPTALAMRVATCITCLLSWKVTSVSSSLPSRSM